MASLDGYFSCLTTLAIEVNHQVRSPSVAATACLSLTTASILIHLKLTTMPLPFHQVFSVLKPIQTILAAILPQFVKRNLKDPAVRDEVVDVADVALLAQVPEAKLVPESVRKSLIRGALAVILDHAVLPEG